jgi:hypothetical protein
VKRRDFLTCSALALLGITARAQPASGEPIIDIHQHLGYSGRPDDVLLAHQRAIGATTTILLPAGRSANRPSTHGGLATACRRRPWGTTHASGPCRGIVAHPDHRGNPPAVGKPEIESKLLNENAKKVFRL